MVRRSPTKSQPSSKRYAAFLRGVTPTNLRMPELKRVFEASGFTQVTTLLSSGNVVFSASPMEGPALERRIEAALEEHLGRTFPTIIRELGALQALLDADPYQGFSLAPEAKRVVTFLRGPPARAPALPLELDGARILTTRELEVFTAYVPVPRGPVFMTLIEKTFGKEVTTRTWDTVRKVAAKRE
jgi:uncharacterized protein (DUF1697 family)